MMYEKAKKLNEELKQLFSSIPIEEFSLEQRERILNLIIRFGSISKYRCRSNTAFDNFCRAVFENIAETKRVKINKDDKFEVLIAEIPRGE